MANPWDYLQQFSTNGRFADLFANNDYGGLADLFLNSRAFAQPGGPTNPQNAYGGSYRRFMSDEGNRLGGLYNLLDTLNPGQFGQGDRQHQFYNAWAGATAPGVNPMGAGSSFDLERQAIKDLLAGKNADPYFTKNNEDQQWQQLMALMGNRMSPQALSTLFSDEQRRNMENSYSQVATQQNAPTFIQFLKSKGWIPGF